MLEVMLDDHPWESQLAAEDKHKHTLSKDIQRFMGVGVLRVSMRVLAFTLLRPQRVVLFCSVIVATAVYASNVVSAVMSIAFSTV